MRELVRIAHCVDRRNTAVADIERSDRLDFAIPIEHEQDRAAH